MVDRLDFQTYVNKLEAKAIKDTTSFSKRLVWVLVLGYVFIAAIILACFVPLVLLILFVAPRANEPGIWKVVLFLILPLALLNFSLLKSLRVYIVKPEGKSIDHSSAPLLFELLDSLARSSQTRGGRPVTFDRVLLTKDLNAGVIQRPQLGIFGWYKNTLMLGLPLMQSVHIDEFKSILAHEYAHLSGQHGRFATWLYRSRFTWEQLILNLVQVSSMVTCMLMKFLRWYWPRLNGHSLALSRVWEYKADEFAASVSSVPTTVNALKRLEVLDVILESVWETLYKKSEVESSPPNDLHFDLVKMLQADFGAQDILRILEHLKLRKTSTEDTHPALQDRVRSLKSLKGYSHQENTQPLDLVEECDLAATHLLPTALMNSTKKRLSLEWKEDMLDYWAYMHQSHLDARKELDELRATVSASTKEEQEHYWEQEIELLVDTGQSNAAEEIATQLMELNPDNVIANFYLGSRRLKINDDSGVSLVKFAMENNVAYAENSLEILSNFFIRMGKPEEIEKLQGFAKKEKERQRRSEAERSTISKKCTIKAHQLSLESLASICKTLSQEERIKRVYIAEKNVNEMPETPMYLVAIECSFAFWYVKYNGGEQGIVDRVADGVDFKTNCTHFVFCRKFETTTFRKIVKTPGSLIYQKGKYPPP